MKICSAPNVQYEQQCVICVKVKENNNECQITLFCNVHGNGILNEQSEAIDMSATSSSSQWSYTLWWLKKNFTDLNCHLPKQNFSSHLL